MGLFAKCIKWCCRPGGFFKNKRLENVQYMYSMPCFWELDFAHVCYPQVAQCYLLASRKMLLVSKDAQCYPLNLYPKNVFTQQKTKLGTEIHPKYSLKFQWIHNAIKSPGLTWALIWAAWPFTDLAIHAYSQIYVIQMLFTLTKFPDECRLCAELKKL